MISYGVTLFVTLLVAAALSRIIVTPFVRRQEQLSIEAEKRAEENKQLSLQIVRSLADAVDAKDPYTNGHSKTRNPTLPYCCRRSWRPSYPRAGRMTSISLNHSAGEIRIAQAMQDENGCFAFFDVDNLKRINDTNGHDAGDKALRLMGEILTENGEHAICCRLGGDEFLGGASGQDDAAELLRTVKRGTDE